MTAKNPIDTALGAAKTSGPPLPSASLVARVLADAAEISPPALTASLAEKPVFWVRFLAPIGGIGGGLALAGCAALGIFIGAGYSDTLFELPMFQAVGFDSPGSSNPLDTLSILMTES
ncbi:MAG: hypothetical protein L3J37_07480 [Rhodobacteraceae bacterium]|nr:hypothetical protein [Paracoccaceae bacterium]